MKIQLATIKDFDQLYTMGKNAPEMRVSTTEEFMRPDEFRWAIRNFNGVFLVAKEASSVVGFIYADIKDYNKPFKNIHACLVFIVVKPDYRRKGIAAKLYKECIHKLKKMSCSHIYVWANAEGKCEIIDFMVKQGFNKGHKYLWMDKKL